MDNERPEVNADSVQLHLVFVDDSGQAHLTAWLCAPLANGAVRVIALDPVAERLELDAQWARTDDGYTLHASLGRAQLGRSGLGDAPLALDVLVNETAPDRERRRGQLVLSGGAGEYVYLRGDRHDPARCLPFQLPHA